MSWRGADGKNSLGDRRRQNRYQRQSICHTIDVLVK